MYLHLCVLLYLYYVFETPVIYVCMGVCMWLLTFCGFWFYIYFVFICDMLISPMTAPDFGFPVGIDVKKDDSCGRNY